MASSTVTDGLVRKTKSLYLSLHQKRCSGFNGPTRNGMTRESFGVSLEFHKVGKDGKVGIDGEKNENWDGIGTESLLFILAEH